eukprot:403374929
MIFTIDSIEGNSHIGVPVFSRSAKKSNYDFIVFSPPKGTKGMGENSQQSLIQNGLNKNSNQEDQQSQRVIQNNLNQSPKTAGHSKRRNKSFNHVQTFERIVSRDKYYQIHGLKREQPRLGNYNPKFDVIEKRVIVPIYGTNFSERGKEAQQSIRIKIEQFTKKEVCNRIMKALESSSQQNLDKSLLQNDTASYNPYENIQTANSSPLKQVHSKNTSNQHLSKLASVVQLKDSRKLRNLSHRKTSSMNDMNLDSSLITKTNNFSFQNEQITDKYGLINEYPDKTIVNDNLSYYKMIEPRIKTRDIFRTMPRQEFVSERSPPNQNRFDPSIETLKQFQTINNSILSSQTRTINFDIGRVRPRDETLIQKGGMHNKALPNYNSNFYDTTVKDKLLAKINTNVLDFDKVNNRSYHGSIYMKEKSPDWYDANKIEKGFQQTSNFISPKAMLDLKKQTSRDFTRMYKQQGEMYANIKRDNERHEYLKRLLSGEDTTQVKRVKNIVKRSQNYMNQSDGQQQQQYGQNMQSEELEEI